MRSLTVTIPAVASGKRLKAARRELNTEVRSALQETSPLGNRSNVVNNIRILAIALLILLTLEMMAQAEPRDNSRNYILRRQQVIPGLAHQRRD